MTKMHKISLVGSPQQDQRYVGLRGAESLGYFGLRHRASEVSDFGSLLACQKFLEAGDSADVDGVLLVHPVVGPFEIGDDVIPFISIDMVDHRKIGGIGNESDGDKTMDVHVLRLGLAPQTDLTIPETVGSRSEKFSIADSRLGPNAQSVKASDATDIAHFVKTFKAKNAAPFFVDHEFSTAVFGEGQLWHNHCVSSIGAT